MGEIKFQCHAIKHLISLPDAVSPLLVKLWICQDSVYNPCSMRWRITDHGSDDQGHLTLDPFNVVTVPNNHRSIVLTKKLFNSTILQIVSNSQPTTWAFSQNYSYAQERLGKFWVSFQKVKHKKCLNSGYIFGKSWVNFGYILAGTLYCFHQK